MTSSPDLRPLADLIPKLRGRRILVVGDLVADRYVLAEPSRLSREAPVVVARYDREFMVPGGAANTVHNLRALEAEVATVGVVGADAEGRGLKAQLEAIGVDVSGVVTSESYRTVTKTRYLVGEANRSKQQLLRIDRDPLSPPDHAAREQVLRGFAARWDAVDAILLSDYGYGLVDEELVELAAGKCPVLTADSRFRIGHFRGVTLATPNEGEVEALVGYPLRNEADLDRAGRHLRERLQSPYLLVTRGNRGMSLFLADSERVDIPATGTDEVTDVSGAGDTVIAVATLGLAAGLPPVDAARIANAAAGVVVMKMGAATCTPAELRAALERRS